MRSLLFLILLYSLFLGLRAVETAQDAWTVPAGTQDDFTVTLRNGQTVPFSWNGWTAPWTDTYLNGKTVNDLWVTSYDYHIAPFQKHIAEDIDVSRAGSFSWSIDIPPSSLSKTAKYVLRFKNRATPRDSYDPQSDQLSSPGFIIVSDVVPTTTEAVNITRTSSTASASATSSTLSSIIQSSGASTSSIPTPTPSAPPPPPDTGMLSMGEKIGLSVGASIGGVAVIALIIWACSSRWRRQSQPSSHTIDNHPFEYPPSKPPAYQYSEAPDVLSMAPIELPARPYLR
ncbi:hypothetical protein AJ79_03169 [Helicocarpus griseus UAMH5409]|uniref:Mid2 domain-containing protein n=1 Tax=Helicocarpus griseus UAMH5409 TaxID=1447875 RepID=A0A2B7XYA8_9EURO|nr:hypothetical protein AJ79_03169 [Helicocarpus griseus UAMH5409]